MCIIYMGSSLNCCLWLDANEITTPASGTLLCQTKESNTVLLCVRMLFNPRSLNSVDVTTLAPTSPSYALQPHPASPAQHAAAGWWSYNPDSRVTRESFHVTTRLCTPAFPPPASSCSFPLSFSFCSRTSTTRNTELSHRTSHSHRNKPPSEQRLWQLNYGWHACVRYTCPQPVCGGAGTFLF